MSKIPIKNIFYMLSYAYDLFPELDHKDFAESDYESSLELFANMLCISSKRILKRGLYREYLQIEEEVNGIKGKVIFKDSLKKDLFSKGHSVCSYDELTYNIPHNQIIYTTLKNLLGFKELRKSTIDVIEKTLFKFPEMTEVFDIKESLNNIKLHQNNICYKLPLCICAMINDLTVLDETSGQKYFVEILRDPVKLQRLFESFVLNFYERELVGFKVLGSKKLLWNAEVKEGESQEMLPEMRMDILIKNQDRTIIIDTKFYGQTLSDYYGKKTIHSSNLYQLMAYLENYKNKHQSDEGFRVPEGILLYPTVNENVDISYKIWGYDVKVKTIDLNLEWQNLHKKIIEIIEEKILTKDLLG